MQILLNSLKALSLLFSLMPLLAGEEPSPPPPPEAAVFLNSRGDLDDAATFVLPNASVDWTAFFLGEGDFLADESKMQS